MNRIWTVALAAIILAVSSGCNNNKTGNLTIVFKGTYGSMPSKPLVMFDTYPYVSGQKIQFTKSDFYLSHVQLAAPTGLAREILEIELMDLSYTNEADAITGSEITIKDVDAGTYNRIDFSIGVDPVMNKTMPADWPSSHPLSESRYWDAWSSYIFAKTEGNLDTLNNGDADLGWLYHTGTDKLYVSLSTTSQLIIDEGKTTRIVFTLDHKELFGVGGNVIDIKGNPINHNPNDSLEIAKITENYATALTFVIEYE